MPVVEKRLPNKLITEKSPYLLQHAHNPVAWYPWCDEAFTKAKAEDKPIFLSIGYSTCHWCHVMEQESFEDEEVAEYLNENFVSIKVDREERADIDAVYMEVCQAITGSGGWPLTIIMTPEQLPFFAATYLPKRDRYRMAGILSVLSNITHMWETERTQLLRAGTEIQAFLQQQTEPFLEKEYPDGRILEQAYRDYQRYFDKKHGGFGHAPKFPTPQNLFYLMQYSFCTGETGAMEMAETTLRQMARGGIFDQIGGGFSRYSTDEKWLVPHFEKMLYDNALLTVAYSDAYQLTGQEFFRTVANKILHYVLREMTLEEGAFAGAQDADSEGVEGSYYLLTPAEIQNVLGEEAQMFFRWFDITEKGHYEGKNIPNLLQNEKYAETDNSIEQSCRQLYDYRRVRMPLRRDDKVLTSWNALMIAAMTRASLQLEEPQYLKTAKKAALFLKQHLLQNGRPAVRWRQGETAGSGQLNDYAFYAWSLLELFQVSGDADYFKEALEITRNMMELFLDEQAGGFYLTASDSENLIHRPKEVYDGAIPSGNAVAAWVLAQLALLTGEPAWQEACDAQMCFLYGKMKEYPIGHGFALYAMLPVFYPASLLVCVTSSPEYPEDLYAFLRQPENRNTVVLWKHAENQTQLAELAPFIEAHAVPARGEVYYLCREGKCFAPVHKLCDLQQNLCTSQTIRFS